LRLILALKKKINLKSLSVNSTITKLNITICSTKQWPKYFQNWRLRNAY